MEIDTNQMKYDPSQHGRSISSFFLYQRIFFAHLLSYHILRCA